MGQEGARKYSMGRSDENDDESLSHRRQVPELKRQSRLSLGHTSISVVR